MSENKIKIISTVDPNIWAEVLADSISSEHDRLTSFHVHYPRIVLAEINTHKIIQKNSSSSRAVPTKTELNLTEVSPFIPSFWGKNKSGMQADESLGEPEQKKCELIWNQIIKYIRKRVKEFEKLGLHKQIANRWLETCQYTNTVLTATEWDNFLHLRNDDAAEPHLHELANCIQIALETSKPKLLNPGEWHLPFINTERNSNGIIEYSIDGEILNLPDAKKISASCCAQVSYRKADTSLEKANDIFTKLIYSDPAHCYIEGTKVLTKNGFKDFREITYEDKIADIDKNTLEFKGWKNPINIINRPISNNEKIYYYNNLKLGITDNHTMIGSIISTQKDRNNLNNLVCFCPGDNGSIKGNKKTAGERECNLPNKCIIPKINNERDYKIGQLFGFYIGDGFRVNNLIHFRLVKKRKVDYLKSLLLFLGIEFKLNENYKTSSGNQIFEFIFYHNDYLNIYKECGDSANTKKIPFYFYDNLDMLTGLFNGLENSDGHKSGKRYTYSTTSEVLANQIVSLATVVGVSAKIDKKQKQNSVFKLTFNSRNYHKINDTRKKESIAKIIENYDKNVYCVTMESGGVVIQTENREILICGNCSPTEHQGTPIDYLMLNNTKSVDWTKMVGITHMDRLYNLWSAGLKGWIQYRKELEHLATYNN